MPSALSPRSTSFATVLGTIILAIAILGWGVQSKLSLYEAPGGHATPITQAKLLTSKERSSPGEIFVASLPQTPIFLPGGLVLGTIAHLDLRDATPLNPDRNLGDEDFLSSDPHVGSNYFSFRPPPASYHPTY